MASLALYACRLPFFYFSAWCLQASAAPRPPTYDAGCTSNKTKNQLLSLPQPCRSNRNLCITTVLPEILRSLFMPLREDNLMEQWFSTLEDSWGGLCSIAATASKNRSMTHLLIISAIYQSYGFYTVYPFHAFTTLESLIEYSIRQDHVHRSINITQIWAKTWF